MKRIIIIILFIHCSYSASLEFNLNPSQKLIAASKFGDMHRVSLLVTSDAKDLDLDTALIEASKSGHLEIVNLLVVSGANIDFQDNFGNTALMYASMKGHIKIVALLISNHANIYIIDKYQETAIMKASRHKHLDIINLLNGGESISIDASDSSSPSEFNHNIVKRLEFEEYGTDVDPILLEQIRIKEFVENQQAQAKVDDSDDFIDEYGWDEYTSESDEELIVSDDSE